MVNAPQSTAHSFEHLSDLFRNQCQTEHQQKLIVALAASAPPVPDWFEPCMSGLPLQQTSWMVVSPLAKWVDATCSHSTWSLAGPPRDLKQVAMAGFLLPPRPGTDTADWTQEEWEQAVDELHRYKTTLAINATDRDCDRKLERLLQWPETYARMLLPRLLGAELSALASGDLAVVPAQQTDAGSQAQIHADPQAEADKDVERWDGLS